MPDVMCDVLLCMLEAVEGGFCLIEALEVLEMPDAMCCVLLCVLETVEGGLCLLVTPDVMCCLVCAAQYAGCPWRVSSVY